jgi:hypothetical protein
MRGHIWGFITLDAVPRTFLCILKTYCFILKETYDSWSWQHRWYQRMYGGNRLASGHLVKSSFFPPRISSTHFLPHFILVFVFVSNDSFAVGSPPILTSHIPATVLTPSPFFFPISFPPPRAFSLVHYFYAHSLLLLLKFDQSNSVSFYPLIIWISLVLSLFLGYASPLFPLLF